MGLGLWGGVQRGADRVASRTHSAKNETQGTPEYFSCIKMTSEKDGVRMKKDGRDVGGRKGVRVRVREREHALARPKDTHPSPHRVDVVAQVR